VKSLVQWFNEHMSSLTFILMLVALVIAWKQLKSKRKADELAERKATLPPDFKTRGSRHGTECLTIPYTIVGRSEFPIKLEKVRLESWDKKNPQKKYRPLEQRLTGELTKDDKPLEGDFLCHRDIFETDETRNLEQFAGYHLFTSIAGELCLHYLDFDGNLKKKCIKIGSLC